MQKNLIGGAMGGGGGSTPTIDPDTLRSEAIVEVIEAWHWGEIEGFPSTLVGQFNSKGNPKELQRVYFDGTPVMNVDGTMNFKGVTFDYRSGTQAQAYIPGYVGDSVGTPVSVQVAVLYGNPITRTISDPSCDAVEINLLFNALVDFDVASGDHRGSAVRMQVDVKPGGSSTWVMAVDPAVEFKNGGGYIHGKTESPYQCSKIIDLRKISSSSTSWDIRVTRYTAMAPTNIQNAFSWDNYVILSYVKLRRPNVAHCRITFDSKYFSSIPQRSYLLRLAKISVPTPDVYDPIARTYTGALWSGTFTRSWSRNPAWYLYYILTTSGAGLGDDINPAYQDKWSIYTIAKRCDELVPDGNGGTQPRYSMDCQIMEQVSAHDLVIQIAGAFDAMALWNGSAVTLIQDAPKPVSGLYLPANVIGGRFTYAGTARQTRYTSALIQYNDPSNQYKLSTEYVEDVSAIQRYGYRPKTETAFGCTTRGQAHRHGNRLLITGREETDSVSFSVGMGGIAQNVGDIIRIADPLRSLSLRFGGRISTGSTTAVITIDYHVTLATGTSYRISIIGQDGSIVDRAVINTSGIASSITIDTALPNVPDQDLEWIIYDPAATNTLWRILSIVDNDDIANGAYTISATQYAPGKFAEIDSLAHMDPLPANPYIVTSVIPPSGLIITEGVVIGLNGISRYFDISWSASNDPMLRGYIVSYLFNGELVYTGETNQQSYRVTNLAIGEYDVNLTAINLTGKQSTEITVIYNVAKMYDIQAVSVTGLGLVSGGTNFNGKDAFFTWSTNADTVLAFSNAYSTGIGGQHAWFRDFEIRVYNGAALLRTEYVTENTYNYSYTKNTEDGGPRRSFTVHVRARDYMGIYSQDAFITVANPEPTNYSAVTLTAGYKEIYVNYIKPTDTDYLSTRIYASQTSGFTPGAANLVNDTANQVTSFPVLVAGTWYVRLQGVDAFGPASVLTTETGVNVTVIDVTQAVNDALANPGRPGDVVVEATRFLVVTPGTTTPVTAVFGVAPVNGVNTVAIKGNLIADGTIAARSLIAGSITASYLSVTNLSAITANMGTLTSGTFKTSNGTGYRVEIGDGDAWPIWYGTGTKSAANALLYADTAGGLHFKGTMDAGSININNRFTVASDGTANIYDGTGTVLFSSGSSAQFTTTNASKLTGIAPGATVGADSTNLKAGVGVNALKNAGWYLGIDGWYPVMGATGTYGMDFFYTTSAYNIRNINSSLPAGNGVNNGTFWIHTGASGTDANCYIVSDKMPCNSANNYEFSIYVAAHRCSANIYVDYFDANGSFMAAGPTWIAGISTITATPGSSGPAEGYTGIGSLSNYKRIWGIQTPPAGSASYRVNVQKQPTIAGQGDSYLFCCLPFGGQAGPGQLTPSPWSDGASGITTQITPATASTYIASASIQTLHLGIDNIVTYRAISASNFNTGTTYISTGTITLPALPSGLISDRGDVNARLDFYPNMAAGGSFYWYVQIFWSQDGGFTWSSFPKSAHYHNATSGTDSYEFHSTATIQKASFTLAGPILIYFNISNSSASRLLNFYQSAAWEIKR